MKVSEGAPLRYDDTYEVELGDGVEVHLDGLDYDGTVTGISVSKNMITVRYDTMEIARTTGNPIFKSQSFRPEHVSFIRREG